MPPPPDSSSCIGRSIGGRSGSATLAVRGLRGFGDLDLGRRRRRSPARGRDLGVWTTGIGRSAPGAAGGAVSGRPPSTTSSACRACRARQRRDVPDQDADRCRRDDEDAERADHGEDRHGERGGQPAGQRLADRGADQSAGVRAAVRAVGAAAHTSSSPEDGDEQRERTHHDPSARLGLGCLAQHVRAAPRRSTSGTSSAPLPTTARAPVSIQCPIGPAAWNQTPMTLIRPSTSTPSAAPSRRCSGGRSRAVAALRPAARASPPTTVASARQIAAMRLAETHERRSQRAAAAAFGRGPGAGGRFCGPMGACGCQCSPAQR